MALLESKALLHLLAKGALYNTDMESELTTLGQRIGFIRRREKLTQAKVAAHLNVTPQAISGWERDESKPDLINLVAFAKLANTAVQWMLHGEGEAYISPDRHARISRALDSINAAMGSTEPIPGSQLVGARDFPIYAAAQGGAPGFMIVHTEVMEYVRRPVILEGVPDSYGVLVVGESMIPAYRSGDMALVHPRRPLERGRDVILYDHDHRTGDAKSMIKHLVSFNDRSLKLEQYNPPKTFTEHRADWPICHQVVGMYKGR